MIVTYIDEPFEEMKAETLAKIARKAGSITDVRHTAITDNIALKGFILQFALKEHNALSRKLTRNGLSQKERDQMTILSEIIKEYGGK